MILPYAVNFRICCFDHQTYGPIFILISNEMVNTVNHTVTMLVFSVFFFQLRNQVTWWLFSSPELMGELIVYQSLWRPSVVYRPSSICLSVRPQFQTSSPLKPLGQLNSNYIWRLLRTRERKFVQMVLVT